MGNNQSLRAIPEGHVRIYKNLISIQSPRTRAEMIQTLLQGPEYVHSFRVAGIYPSVLQYASKVGRGEHPGFLPGETGSRQEPPPPPPVQTAAAQQFYSVVNRQETALNPHQRIMKQKSNDKALSYFQTCLQVLELEEEVALTEEMLKKAYKRASIKAHPDKKGGSEEHFAAVTRAYSYLIEIVRRIQGGRQGPLKKVEAPNLLKTERTDDEEKWKVAEPIRLNPSKLDMNAFNQMFEQTRIPEPDEDGYGDWLKEQSGTNAPKFSGKFNRDVFNSMFEEEAAKTRESAQRPTNALMSIQPMVLNAGYGVELGRGKPSDYTAPANADQGLGYTDLRAAYTTENTFSGQVAGINVEKRDFSQYQESRKRAPDPLRNDELSAIQQMEKEMEEREKKRQIRAAQEILAADEYRQRMSRLVITDGSPVGRDGYSRR